MCEHKHHHHNCNHEHKPVSPIVQRSREARFDPTQTTGLRIQFLADVRRRFRRLNAVIWKEIIDKDGFGFKTQQRFDFPRSDQKVDAFMDWLREQQDREILSVTRGRQLGGRERWSDTYIESAYQAGLARSTNALDAAGLDPEPIDTAFFKPIHADRSALAFTRTFSELEGITEAMDQGISRALAQGLAEGRGPKKIAQDIQDRVDAIGKTRAERMARTETIRAHAEASLNTFADAGLDEVTAEVEFVTAGDDRVCPTCEALSGRIFSIDEARGVIPVHPNCRCAWVPVVRPPTEETGPNGEDFDILTPSEGDRDQYDRLLKDVWGRAATRPLPRAVQDYTDIGYEDINAGLRGEISLSIGQRAQVAAINASARKLPKNTVLFRGTSAENSKAAADFIQSLKPGKTFRENAFFSTATDPNEAMRFQSESGRLPGILFRVFTPKGTKIIRGLDSETELLLQTGQKFRVLQRRQVTKSNARIVGVPPGLFKSGRKIDVVDVEIVK